MKKIFVLLFPILLFFACSEIPPNVGGGPIAPGPGTIQKKVLIEEFTGVQCVNCPGGARAIEELINIHGEDLIAVSIHATDQFATPMVESTIDFRLEDSETLLSFIEFPEGFPTAVVNRNLFDGESQLQLAKTKWAGYIQQELSSEAEASIELEGDINDSGRMNVTADVLFLDADPSVQYKFTLMITEDNIVNAQIDTSGLVLDYVHKHVLRDIITTTTGEDISSSEPVNLTFDDYAIPADWDNSELSIIGIVHSSGTEKRVLQVEQIKF